MAQAVDDQPARPPLRIFADLLGENKRRVVELVVYSTASGLTEAGLLAVVAQVAASLATRAHSLNATLGPVHLHASIPLLLEVGGALAFARLALQVPTSYIPARVSSDVQARLRTNLFEAFTQAAWGMQASDREGQLQELMGSQIVQASQGAVQAMTLVSSLTSFAALLASALLLNAKAAALVLVVSVGMFAALRPLSAAGSRLAREYSRAQLAAAGGVSEATRLAEATQVFGVGAAQRERVGALVETSQKLYFRAQLIARVAPSTYQSLIYILLVGGLALVYEFTSGGVASLGAVVLLLVRAAGYGNNMQTAYQIVKQSMPFLDRVSAAEDRYRQSAPTPGHRPLPSIESLAFDRVSYAYSADRLALDHVTFEIRDGEAVGIVGPSGAGKSTFAQLLLRLREPTSGRFLINGEDALEFRQADWERQVAYVPQAANLIHASVTENISYLRSFTDADVDRAATLAGVQEDILSWPLGYDTIIGPRADAVSGGQAQRICLARALVGRPKVLLLDEPTSAVDMRSERLIQDSLLALKGEVTMFIIAHRISTLDMCDRVMVLLDGRLTAFETLSQLREHNAYYQSVTEGGTILDA